MGSVGVVAKLLYNKEATCSVLSRGEVQTRIFQSRAGMKELCEVPGRDNKHRKKQQPSNQPDKHHE